MTGERPDYYSEAEEVALGAPIGVFETCCDVSGCDGEAEIVIPGAALCRACSTSFGIGAGGLYEVPLNNLTGDERWRDARRELYVDELRELRAARPRRRDARTDARLAELVAGRVEELLAE